MVLSIDAASAYAHLPNTGIEVTMGIDGQWLEEVRLWKTFAASTLYSTQKQLAWEMKRNA